MINFNRSLKNWPAEASLLRSRTDIAKVPYWRVSVRVTVLTLWQVYYCSGSLE